MSYGMPPFKSLFSIVCAQLCPTLQLHDCSPPGYSVHGVFQARILQQVAISCSRGSSWPRDRTHVSCVSCIGRQILYHLCHLWSPLLPNFRVLTAVRGSSHSLVDVLLYYNKCEKTGLGQEEWGWCGVCLLHPYSPCSSTLQGLPGEPSIIS